MSTYTWAIPALRDLYADEVVPVKGQQITLSLPPASGRVYMEEVP